MKTLVIHWSCGQRQCPKTGRIKKKKKTIRASFCFAKIVIEEYPRAHLFLWSFALCLVWSRGRKEHKAQGRSWVSTWFVTGCLTLGALGTAQSTAALLFYGGYPTFLEDCEVEWVSRMFAKVHGIVSVKKCMAGSSREWQILSCVLLDMELLTIW